MARLELERGTDVLLLETGDALLLEVIEEIEEIEEIEGWQFDHTGLKANWEKTERFKEKMHRVFGGGRGTYSGHGR